MKRLLIISIMLFITLASFGQLVRPNRPGLRLDGSKGYITINEFTAGYGLSGQTVPYSKHYFGFTSLHAYQANETFLVGAGTGILFYNDGILIPLYIDLRIRLMQNFLFPYLSGSAGMLLNPSDFDSGSRLFINPAVGVIYTVYRNLALNINAGLKIQMTANAGRASFVNSKFGVTYKF